MRRLGPIVLFAIALCPAAHGSPSYAEVAHIHGSAGAIGLAGPTLSGEMAIWGQRDADGTVSVERSGRAGRAKRIIFQAAAPRLPVDAGRAGYEVGLTQQISALASTRARFAFIRSVGLSYRPRCLDQTPPCAAPSFAVPLFGELWAESSAGRLRRLAGGPVATLANACAHWRPTSVDLAASAVVYAEELDSCAPPSSLPRRSRVIEVAKGRRIVLATSARAPLGPVAAAGSWAAWVESASTAGAQSLVVWNLRTQATAYRVDLRGAVPGDVTPFDVNERGQVAVALPPSGACSARQIALASRATSSPRRLRFWTQASVLRLDASRIVAAAERVRCGRLTQLAAIGFHGSLRPLVRFTTTETPLRSLAGAFDAHARHFVFATTARSSDSPTQFTTSIYIGTT